MDQTKKIILASLGVALIAFFIGGGTYAYFSDVEEVESRTFTAGTLDLSVGDVIVPVNVPALKPGDKNVSFANWSLTNSGNVEGLLNISVSTVTNNENGRLDPELDEDDDDNGELGENLKVALWIDNGSKYYLNPSDASGMKWVGPVDPVDPIPEEGYYLLDIFSENSTTVGTPQKSGLPDIGYFNIAYDLPYETDNDVQSDNCSFNITFTLRQFPQ